LLGVPRNATDAEIRSAFRQKAAQHHPDRNPDDASAQQRFADLNRAYQILSDDQKRAAWDRFGEAAFRPGGFDGTGVPFTHLADLEDALKSVLGSFGLRRGPKNAVKVKVTLGFEEAIRGCRKSVSYDTKQLCGRCSGNGGEPGAPTTQCGACEGTGKVRPLVQILPLQRDRECSACHGTGLRAVRPCTTCRGEGVFGVRRTLEVNFPAGVDSGYRRTLKGEGNRPTAGKSPGPLIVEVEVAPHDFFTRQGDDLYCRVPITFPQAALGAEIGVRTIDGQALLKIPEGVQSNSVLRMRGKGATRAHLGGRGDQLVEVVIDVPAQLSERARELLLELSDELALERPNPQRSWKNRILDRLR
jgi:molecular chaperone DnaJ